MVTTLDKFDLNSVHEYLYELTEHISKKSEGDLRMVFIVGSFKDKEFVNIYPKTTEKKAVHLLIMALKELAKDFPEIGVKIRTI